jgi:DNA-binding CsgD family transcriptional regulator/PAS domain-containing protein
MHNQARNEVVQELYAAAMGTASWPAALARLAEYTGTRFVSLDSYCMNKSVGRVHACNIPPDHPALVQYIAENGTGHELIERAFPHQTPGALVRASDLIPDRDFFGTNIYHDFFRPLRMKYVVGLTLELTPDSITEFSLIKPHDAPDFSERDLRQLRDLQPDLTQIWHGYRHLASIQERLDTLQSLWDCFEHAVIVADNSQKIQFANRAAESLLRTRHWLVSENGKLAGATAPVQARLQSAVQKLREHEHEITSLTPEAGTHALDLLVTLFRIDDDRLALVLTDPARSKQSSTAALQQYYQMTATEANLINALLHGQSLRDYAEQQKITYETTRTHLKNAMKKNGWRRQGEMLVAIFDSMMGATYFSVTHED